MMNTIIKEKGYKKLKVWEVANKFVILIYRFTNDFPKNEEYGLISQIRRSALSIPTNIVEGQASTSKKEFLNFLNIANRSLVETEYLLELAVEFKYLARERHNELDILRREIGVLLNGLIRSIKTRLCHTDTLTR